MGAAAGMDVNELTSVFNESVGEIVQTMVNSGYSQTQEFDADNTAMSLMASAGYNPQGLLEMLRSLGTGGGSGFGKTHPTPEQRIKNAEKSVGKYNVANNSSFRQARFGAAVK